jgi:hypothetical protein
MQLFIYSVLSIVVFISADILLSYPAFGMSYISGKLIAGGVTIFALLVNMFLTWLLVERKGTEVVINK